MSTWPTGSVPTTNVDATTDDPSQARADFLSLIQKVNDMIGALGQASGVASLDTSGHVPSGQLALALLLGGGTMTGKITLDGDPTANLHAATKQYVDNAVAAAAPFGSSTKMLFRNLTVSGWTKDTSFNEHAIRIVTGGTLSAGGATDLTTVFGSGKTTASHTLTSAESGVPAHTHATDSQGAHTHTNKYGTTPGGTNDSLAGTYNFIGNTSATNSNGAHTHTAQANTAADASSGHTHNLSLDLKYMDMILFTKD